MSNLIQKTTDTAMYMACGYMKPGGVFVDATCGNGHDTLAMMSMKPSKLYAFDIQQTALDNTRSLLRRSGYDSELASGVIRLICDSHENMSSYVRGQADVIMFNLGYLPGERKDITTQTASTVKAVRSALQLLAKDGLICVTMYSGHPEGRREKEALLAMAQKLDAHLFHCAYISMINQSGNPPEILLITKKR